MSAHMNDGTAGKPKDSQSTTFTITIRENKAQPASRKLADAEIRFKGRQFDGVVLSGFAVWVNRTGTGENVTFSSRQFCVSGERRTFSMLRWIAKREAQERMADVVVRAYRRHRNGAVQDQFR